jgi:hypothetical protein
MCAGRDASSFDWLADAAGTMMAVYGYWRVKDP